MANPVTRIIITAKDEASAVFGSLQAKVAGIAAAIGGYFGAKLFGDAIGSARDFESAMSAVQAASGASAEELAQLRAAAEEAGATTKFTSVEAANALETLAKSGLSASQAVQALPAVLNLAQAGGVGLAQASDYVTKAVNGMGMSFAEAGRVADVLAMGANASNTSVEGLAGALSYAAPLANTLGLSLEQTVAIIGKFADAGIDASRAGTALNAILAQFSNPASTFRKELAAAGITTSDFDQALRQLAAAGPAGQRAINAVGTEAGPALRALLNQGIGSLDALKAKLDESAGSAATFAQVMGDNLDGATKGFGRAWDALLIKLGSPVLDTLKDQINAVSERLRGFVADGTATAFGNAIKTAFEAAGKWVTEFVGKTDFTQVAANLQAFAARVGEVFTAIGSHATTAGTTLQTAYGVMSAGVNVVLAAVYKLGQGASLLASTFLSDLALITQGLAKITFGDLSAGFATAAASMRAEAQATYAVYEAFGVKAGEAFDAATAGATRAQEGWATLTGSAAASSSSIQTSAAAAGQSLDTLAEKTGLTADEFDALGKNATVSGGKVVESATASAGALNNLGTAAKASSAEQQKAAQAVKVDVEALYQEYVRLFAAGDTQAAAAKFAELQRLMRDTSQQATTTADDVQQAFQNLGVTSQAELNRLANSARQSFETIRASGTATPRELQAAFVAYAQKAIEANGGVASESLKTEAAIYKVRIEADATGQAIVSAMSAAATETDALANSAANAANAYAALGNEIQSLPSPPPAPSAGSGATSGGGSFDETWMRLVEQNPYRGNSLETYQRWLATMQKKYKAAIARQNAQAESLPTPQPETPKGGSKSRDPITGLPEQFISPDLQKLLEQQAQAQQVGKTYTVNVNLPGSRQTSINTASQQDANALVSLLQQLETDAMRS